MIWVYDRYRIAFLGNVVVLFLGMALSWYHSTLHAPVISYLLSPHLNRPNNAILAATCLFLAAILLAFAVQAFLSLLARIAIRIGAAGLMLMAALTFSIERGGQQHDTLTAITLLLLLSGIGLESQARHTMVRLLLMPLLCVSLLLCAAYLLPTYFNESHWWHSLALAEWSLILFLEASLFLLLALPKDQRIRTSSF